ncbi:hypothetical protein HQ590_15940 [bacterium]|nr:hypothetical protein [bacterium]
MRSTNKKPTRPPAAPIRPGRAALLLVKWLWHRVTGGDGLPHEPPPEQPARGLDPLDQIREYLGRRGLDRQVRVRCEPAGRGFVLEDDDGCVYADDYDAAVLVIEQIWLYQP